MSASRIEIDRDGTRLSVVDLGGSGESALLLHGLAGHAGEWVETAGWLAGRRHVIALEARGHGHSERHPDDVSAEAQVEDAATAIDQLGGGRSIVIGHSLGGSTAIRLAARRPGSVSALVVADAGVSADGADEVDQTIAAISAWPVPFRDLDHAVEFFGGAGSAAAVWAGGLEERRDGWWPRFDVGVLRRTLAAGTARALWDEWSAVSCPTLIVRGSDGTLDLEEARAMQRASVDAELLTLDGAGHDLHLDRPSEWRRAVEAFIDRLDLTGADEASSSRETPFDERA